MRIAKSAQNPGVSAILLSLAFLALISCGGPGENTSASKDEAAAENTPSAAKASPAADRFSEWVEYSSEPHGFSILAPQSFDVSRDTTQTVAGDIELTTYLAELGKAAYGVVCNDFPEGLVEGKDPAILIKGGIQGFVNQFGGRLSGERYLSLNGHSGLEIALTGSTQGVDIFAKGRFYLVGTRMYQVTVIAEKGSEDMAAIDAYLGSFKLK